MVNQSNSNTRPRGRIRVLCLERKDSRARALEDIVSRMDDVEWIGRVEEPAAVIDEVRQRRADVVLLDLDLPGPNPFATVERLRHARPGTRTIVFSRRVQPELIERAFASGAWGFVSKHDGTAAIASAIPRVAHDEYVMGPEIEAAFIPRHSGHAN